MAELIPVAPEVLIGARRSALATLEEAAERTGQTSEAIRDWEAGRSQPTYSQLERMADEYGVSVNVLLLPTPPHTPEPPPDFRSPLEGIREPISRPTRRELRRARYLQNLLTEVPALPPPSLPVVQPGQDADAVARQSLGVSLEQQLAWKDEHEAFRAWRTAFNRLGILVLQHALPLEELSGLSLAAADGGPPVVLINQSDWPNRRNFTMLHELGHLVLAHEGGICDPWRQALRLPSSSLEARCNRFAGAVLVPAGHLRQQSESQHIAAEPETAEIIKLLGALGRRYRVSAQVVWYRLHELELVSDQVFHALWPQLRPPSKRKRPAADQEARTGIPRWQRARSSYGPQLLNGLLGAVERGAVAPTRIMRVLNLGTGDLTRLQSEAGGA